MANVATMHEETLLTVSNASSEKPTAAIYFRHVMKMIIKCGKRGATVARGGLTRRGKLHTDRYMYIRRIYIFMYVHSAILAIGRKRDWPAAGTGCKNGTGSMHCVAVVPPTTKTHRSRCGGVMIAPPAARTHCCVCVAASVCTWFEQDVLFKLGFVLYM